MGVRNIIDKIYLKTQSALMGVNLTNNQLDKLDYYAKLIYDYNKKVNLTRITSAKDIAIKHFLDSLTINKLNLIDEKTKTLDVGSGAGLPGIVLAITTNAPLTLIDSQVKRTTFLQFIADELDLKNVQVICQRAETAAHQNEFREKFDIVCARAVAKMPSLVEYMMGFVKINGFLLAMKGPNVIDELKTSKTAISQMGGKDIKLHHLTLSDAGQRTLVVIKKVSATPKNLPRTSGKIKLNPL